MRPSLAARRAAAVTLSKGKMYEFNVPLEHHIKVPEGLDLEEQFPLAVGTLGDFAAETVRKQLDLNGEIEPTLPEDLQFAGRVLQAFVDSRHNTELNRALLLLASAAFYLSGRPGDSIVTLKRLPAWSNTELGSLEAAVERALSTPWSTVRDSEAEIAQVGAVVQALATHFQDGSSGPVLKAVARLHAWAYANGTAHELLLADILGATALSRVERSAWTLLPRYSGLSNALWSSYLLRDDAIREVWPSQRMLGEANIFSGASAVVQMPTSAGKTRAVELLIRSSFLAERTTMCVVVAPFRALCQEIANTLRLSFATDGYEVNQLSDALQPDYVSELLQFLGTEVDVAPHIVILTPEKLLYVLRQESNLVNRIGLIVYDEGHQFDTGQRGVTYELLITSIKRLLPDHAQTVLVSAVVRNAAALASWLLQDPERIVTDNRLQTHRTVAFATWPSASTLGQLEFNRGSNVEQPFFVPRVIEAQDLDRKPREKQRRFPERGSQSIALYLALRLVPNGAVAIFCGLKASAAKLVRDAVEEVFARGPELPRPSQWCDANELRRLQSLFRASFGNDSYLTRGAGLGLFAHHGSTPHGLRLAVEHAMRANLIRLVVCTSTLAQGVNLPIRYLLITTTLQGGDDIKARDFHNLMGRAGRAGMHGEGTVIFTDPKLYDERQNRASGGYYRWRDVQTLLAPENSEPTGSSLLDLFLPLTNERGDASIDRPSRFEVVSLLVRDRASIFRRVANLRQQMTGRGFSAKSLTRQLNDKVRVLEGIESFLMTYREDDSADAFYERAQSLARETFAYSLADGEEREWLPDIFDGVARRIEAAIPDVDTQARIGRTLLGVDTALEIDKWAKENAVGLTLDADEEAVLRSMWPLLSRLAPEDRLRDTQPEESLMELALGWIAGKSFEALHKALEAAGATYPHGAQRRRFSIDSVVELCEQTFGFEFSLILAATTEALSECELTEDEEKELRQRLMMLQKRLKYGLPSGGAIAFFELGFAERVVAMAANEYVGLDLASTTAEARGLLLGESDASATAFFGQFPAYFQSVYEGIVRAAEE